MTLKIETIDSIAAAGGKVTIFGAAGSALLTFAVNNFAGLMGVLIALLGFWVNLHYKRKADKRREQEFLIDTRLKENADRRFEEWQKHRIEMSRRGIDVPPITDFGALAPAAGPWVDSPVTRKRKDEEEDDGDSR